MQRLNPFVIEAQIFERAIKITSLKTIVNYSIDTGNFYGLNWTPEEFEILKDIELALRKDYSYDVLSIQKFINEKLQKNYEINDLTAVLSKIETTEGKIMREKLPYLTDFEYTRLNEHKKKKKRKVR